MDDRKLTLLLVQQYSRHLNCLLNRSDVVFSGTVEKVSDAGRSIVIQIKSLFKGEQKNSSITLLANEPSSLSLLPRLDEKEETSRWPKQRFQLMAADCFAYGQRELKERDSRVFFAQVSGSSYWAILGIQISRPILAQLRILSLSKCFLHYLEFSQILLLILCRVELLWLSFSILFRFFELCCIQI